MSTPANRPKRTPIHARNVMKVMNASPGKVGRVVNDVDDRIEIFKEAGYVPVQRPVKMGDTRVDAASQLGSVKSMPVGGGVRGVYMEIDKDLYEEDQRAKSAKIAKQNGEMLPSDLEDFYGKGVEIKRPVSNTRSTLGIKRPQIQTLNGDDDDG